MTRRASQYDLESRWVTAAGIPGVSYRFSDLVRIKSGEYFGQTAEVIALMSIEPEPVYGVVLTPDEKFVVLSQQDLDSTGSTRGRTLTLHKPI